jgi:hypothetical protein
LASEFSEQKSPEQKSSNVNSPKQNSSDSGSSEPEAPSLEEANSDSEIKINTELIRRQMKQHFSEKLKKDPEEDNGKESGEKSKKLQEIDSITEQSMKKFEEKLPDVLKTFKEKCMKFFVIDQCVRFQIQENDFGAFAQLLDETIGENIRQEIKKNDHQNSDEIKIRNSVDRLEDKCNKIVNSFGIEGQNSWIKLAIKKGRLEIIMLILIYNWQLMRSEGEEISVELQELLKFAFQENQKKIVTLFKKLFKNNEQDEIERNEILEELKEYPVYGKNPIKRNLQFASEIIERLTNDLTDHYIR